MVHGHGSFRSICLSTRADTDRRSGTDRCAGADSASAVQVSAGQRETRSFGVAHISGAGEAFRQPLLQEDSQRQDHDGQGEREDRQRHQDPEVGRVALEHVRVGLAGLPARRLGSGTFVFGHRLFGHAGTIPEETGGRRQGQEGVRDERVSSRTDRRLKPTSTVVPSLRDSV